MDHFVRLIRLQRRHAPRVDQYELFDGFQSTALQEVKAGSGQERKDLLSSRNLQIRVQHSANA